MKKVLVIHPSLGYGGAEKMMAFVTNCFAEVCEVELMLLQDSDITLELNPSVNVEKYNLYSSEAIIGKNMLNGVISFLHMTKTIKSIIKKKKPDIVFGFDLRVLVAIYYATRSIKVKVLFSERADPYLNSKRWRKIIKKIYKNIDYVVFQTQGAKEFYGNLVENKSTIIPNPAMPRNNTKEVEKLEFEYPYIFSAGQMQWRKGFDILIEAFYKISLAFPEYHLVLFGEGNEKEHLVKLAKEYGLMKKIHFYAPINNVIEKNLNAELFIIPSRSEGIPNILIEAMYAGIPSVATDCSPGGARLLSDDGKYCVLCERENVNALYEAIVYGLKNKKEMHELSEKAKKGLKRFKAKKISDEWKKLIMRI